MQTTSTSPAVPAATARAAYFVGVAGSAQRFENSDLIEVEPGAPIQNGQRVTIGTESHVDIQFGSAALSRVHGPAEFIVRTQAGPAAVPVMDIDLISGSVASKVHELGILDSFRIRTPNAIYVVRGTEFHVEASRTERLDVTDGQVAVLPRALDIPVLRSVIAGDQELEELLSELQLSAPSFGVGQPARLDVAMLEQAQRLSQELEEQLRTYSTATDDGSLIEQLRTAVRETQEVLPGIAVAASPPREQIEAKLETLASLNLLPVPKDPQNISLLETEDAARLVKFTLRTLPQNAEIFVDGAYVGQSVYRAVLRANQRLSIRVARPGYRERRIEIDRARSEVLTVSLERLPPSISAESFLQAIAADDIGAVRTYVQEGGSVDVRTDRGTPALVHATGIVPVLVGQTPDLSYDRDIVRTIVAAGADLEAPFVVEGSTFRLLHAAVLAGVAGFDVSSLVQLLIDSGADVDGTIVLEGEELTPLAVAVRWALFTGETQEELVKILLASGASLDVTISYNDELLTLREIATELVRQGSVEDDELLLLLRQAGVVI
ncbi:MAG: FecR domain-containing protein [Spirochaetales bacterium]